MNEMVIGLGAFLLGAIKANMTALINNRGGSVNKASKVLYVPVIVGEDIPVDVANSVCDMWEKTLGIRLKGLIEDYIHDTPDSLATTDILKMLPIKNVANNKKVIQITPGESFVNGISDAIGENVRITAEGIFMKNINTSIEEEDLIKNYNIREADILIKNTSGSPTFIEAEMNYISGKGEIKSIKNTFEIKVVPRQCKNSDIATMVSKYDRTKTFRKYIKLTRGEDKFLRDYLLEIDDIKKSAKSAVEGKNPIISLVDSEAMQRRFTLGYSYPFASMIISDTLQTELGDIGIDIDSDKGVQSVMNSIGLLYCAVYDVSLDIIKVGEHGTPYTEKYPLVDYVSETDKMQRELQALVRMSR